MEGVGGSLAERWLTPALVPAFVFWAGGLAAWYMRGEYGFLGWGLADLVFVEGTATGAELNLPSQLPLETPLLALLIGILIVSAVSAAVVQRVAILFVLRWAEGYWPRPLNFLRRRLVERRVARSGKQEVRYQELNKEAWEQGGLQKLSETELDEYMELDQSLRRTPQEHLIMPTELGNILRASETKPEEKYGLNAVICWPRLWLLLPEEARSEISQARASLDTGAHVLFWSLLFIVWSIWAWWALLGVLVAILAYRGMLSAATIYADLVESAFDVHRQALYHALRWPLPRDPASEQQIGQELTQYLWRGSDQDYPTFVNPPFSTGGE